MSQFVNECRDGIVALKEESRHLVLESLKSEVVEFISPLLDPHEFKDYFNHSLGQEVVSHIVETFEREKCSIFFYDKNGMYVSCLYGQANNIYGRETILKDASLNKAGLNAVSGVMMNKESCIVVDEEHTVNALKHITGYASWIKDISGKLEGILYIVSASNQLSEDVADLLSQMKRVLSTADNIPYAILMPQLYLNILVKLNEHVSEGIAFIDDQYNVHGYNKRLLTMLDIDESQPYLNKAIYQKILKIENFRDKEFKNRSIIYETKNKKKSLLVSSEHITLMNDYAGTLITFIDTEDVSKLNHKIKGNQTCYNFEDIIGHAPKLVALKEMAKKVATTESHVLIHGESGTGKELLAQSIHNQSNRNEKPFIAINCGAMPLELMESELFGYEPGTFTGASKSGKIGKIEFSSGGTLFLDEIESMPLSLQIKLLRVLSTNTVTRLGSVIEVPVDLRIIAATKKDLLQEARLGNFREDLYYRIQVIDLRIPPLRERKEDIEILSNHMINKVFRHLYDGEIEIDVTYYHALNAYDWPGNIRELRNTIERSLVIKGDEALSTKHLREHIVECYRMKEVVARLPEETQDDEGLLESFERVFIKRILEEEHGNMTEAARKLGISRQTLYRKLKW